MSIVVLYQCTSKHITEETENHTWGNEGSVVEHEGLKFVNLGL
jgi:hypothetical protein